VSVDRPAARGLHPELEQVWDRLRAEFDLQDGFWLAVIFGAQRFEADELVARSRDLARRSVRAVRTLSFGDAPGVAWLLAELTLPAPTDLAATWIQDEGVAEGERHQLWVSLLRRMNERRDRLVDGHPAALILLCPAGTLPMVRAEAPDLWSFRTLTATVSREPRPGDLDTEPTPIAGSSGALLPVVGEPVHARPAVRKLLRSCASALRSGRLDLAAVSAEEARAKASTAADQALAHAWLAQVRFAQHLTGDAAREARAALAAGLPLEESTTIRLLEILLDSDDLTTAAAAADALIGVRRELARRHSESPESLRDLSLALDSAGGVAERRGELEAAAGAYGESLDLRRRRRQG
jgi:hypothetical protein